MGSLTREDARRFYDRFGRRQDWQWFYEDRALDEMISHASFGTARRVCEFGCGTGRLGARLLGHFLPDDASYLGLDISSTMVDLARHRMHEWGRRARVIQTDGTPEIPADGFDRIVSTYVLDLLSADDIDQFLASAHRSLAPDGLLCVVNLTCGDTAGARILGGAWNAVYHFRPQLVGGCRAITLAARLPLHQWQQLHRSTVRQFGICSEITIARPQPESADNDPAARAPCDGGMA